MSGKRYTDEFKIEVVKQVTEKGHKASEVASRLGISSHSIYAWVKKYGPDSADYKIQSDQQFEINRLKKELRRVTEERDILKRPQRTLPKSPSKVRIYTQPSHRVPDKKTLYYDASASQWILFMGKRA